MKSIKKLMDFFFSTDVGIVIFSIFASLIAIYVCLILDGEKLQDTLRGFAQLNITIAIGLGTISISLKKNDRTFDILNEILLIMVISILSYFLAVLDNYLLLRTYLILSTLTIIYILLSVWSQIKELKKESKIHDSQKLKSRKERFS